MWYTKRVVECLSISISIWVCALICLPFVLIQSGFFMKTSNIHIDVMYICVPATNFCPKCLSDKLVHLCFAFEHVWWGSCVCFSSCAFTVNYSDFFLVKAFPCCGCLTFISAIRRHTLFMGYEKLLNGCRCQNIVNAALSIREGSMPFSRHLSDVKGVLDVTIITVKNTGYCMYQMFVGIARNHLTNNSGISDANGTVYYGRPYYFCSGHVTWWNNSYDHSCQHSKGCG